MALFHRDIYNTERMPPSYWEATAPIPRGAYAPLEGDAGCDVVIIGGGLHRFVRRAAPGADWCV